MSPRLRIARFVVHAYIGFFLIWFTWKTFAHNDAWPTWVRLVLLVAILAWMVDLWRLVTDLWRDHNRGEASQPPHPEVDQTQRKLS